MKEKASITVCCMRSAVLANYTTVGTRRRIILVYTDKWQHRSKLMFITESGIDGILCHPQHVYCIINNYTKLRTVTRGNIGESLEMLSFSRNSAIHEPHLLRGDS